MRRHEERRGALEDAAAVAAARRLALVFEARILRRAEVLGEREGWRDALLRWRARMRIGLTVAAAMALVLGFTAAAGVLGDGGRPVNVVWALGGLLGVHLASLALWLIGMLLAGSAAGGAPQAGGVAARLWLRIVTVLDRSPQTADLPLALGGLLGRGRAAAWRVGAVSHGLWALALGGAAAGLLLLFATRRYGFVWETTILPAQTFTSLTLALGMLPAQLGFPVPDAATVAASGDAAMLQEAGRRAWAGWLIGCLLVYGVLPRLALALACTTLWRRAARRVALDLSRPGYARLRARLLPDSERIGVRDAEPETMPRPGRRGVHPAAGEGCALVALELGRDLPWPPACVRAAPVQAGEGGGHDEGRLDSREQRRAALAHFAAHPPRRLLIAIDPRQTPDRGSLGLIAELADRAVEAGVWALAAPAETGAASERLRLWREGLARLDFPAEALFIDAGAACDWLEEGR
ncbi:hypothetical protein CCZ27_21555 [Thauera sinica]|nr:hypothetical protein CCZ27_21555 [Thauera sp. K11]